MTFFSDFGRGFQEGFTGVFTSIGSLFGGGGGSGGGGGGIASGILNMSGIPQLIETGIVLLHPMFYPQLSFYYVIYRLILFF